MTKQNAVIQYKECPMCKGKIPFIIEIKGWEWDTEKLNWIKKERKNKHVKKEEC